MDIFADKNWAENLSQRIDLERGGVFVLAPNIDVQELQVLHQRVLDAQERFMRSPLAQVANQLEKEVVVSSVFGTNSIEGGSLDEEETQKALEMDPAQVQEEQQRRAVNIKSAYDLARQVARQKDWQLSTDYILEAHRRITDKLPDERNGPGIFRDNPKDVVTRVGAADHGGQYKPPQNGRDIRLLVEALVDWNRQLKEAGVPVLLRAPLIHLHFEWIHPFWDGNGRVGRVLEATLLKAEGFEYAPFAQARHYLAHIHQYFALFNSCRKAAEKDDVNANTAFVEFFLEGMLSSISHLHDRVNRIVEVLLFRNHLRDLLDAKEVNERQCAVVQAILDAGKPLPLQDLRSAPWYKAMYSKLTDKTQRRDLQKLKDLELILQTSDNRLWPGFTVPDNEVVE